MNVCLPAKAAAFNCQMAFESKPLLGRPFGNQPARISARPAGLGHQVTPIRPSNSKLTNMKKRKTDAELVLLQNYCSFVKKKQRKKKKKETDAYQPVRVRTVTGLGHTGGIRFCVTCNNHLPLFCFSSTKIDRCAPVTWKLHVTWL